MHGEGSQVLVSARQSSAFGYGALAIFAVVYFEYRLDFLDFLGGLVLVPYVAFVFGSSLMAYLLGSWYLRNPVTGIFEILTVPVMVIVCSAVTAGVLFWITARFSGSTSPYATLLDALAGGFAAAIYFVFGAWPVLLMGAFAVTTWLAWRYGRGTVANAF